MLHILENNISNIICGERASPQKVIITLQLLKLDIDRCGWPFGAIVGQEPVWASPAQWSDSSFRESC